MKIAINTTIIDKAQNKADFARITTTFENVDLSQDDLAHQINQGHAFCAHHKNHHRRSDNFTSAGFLAVDIDHGLIIDEALSNDFVKKYAAILYKTPSHTEEQHRFRILFELDRDITDAEIMKMAYRGISKKFGGDPSCTDACRLFFGSKDSAPTVFGNILPSVVLDKIIQLGRESHRQHDHSENDHTTAKRSIVRSILTLDEDDLIRTSSGETLPLKSIPVRTSVYCPVHIDHTPSAFTLRSKRGMAGIHCSTCAATFFVKSEPPSFDFNYALENLNEAEHLIPDGAGGRLSITTPGVATRINQQYIHLDDTQAFDKLRQSPDWKKPEKTKSSDGMHKKKQSVKRPPPDRQFVSFIKSAKGSGKTQLLMRVVEMCKKSRRSVLLIGHRRSLILSSAKRLGLTPYIGIVYEPARPGNPTTMAEHIKTNRVTNRYAICADSLSTILTPATQAYDVVLIDEIEQVLGHLTSDTVKNKRNDTIQYFKRYIDSAELLFVLDADLNQLTINTISDMVSDPKRQVEIVVNDWKAAGRELFFYEDKNHLKDEVLSSLLRGQKCFICSNSKRMVNQLADYIAKEFGDRLKVLAITSDNSDTSAIQEFIGKINTEILNYDALIVSPSVGTGVDISFPDGEQRIDVVYGFFEARVNTHFDIDQQLSRVRNPKRVAVWISPEKFSFETETEVIKQELVETDRSARHLVGFDDDGTPKWHTDVTYLNLFANVTAQHRASKNNLRVHFQKLKEFNGWKIIEVTKDEDASKRGLEITRASREALEQERIAQILGAKLITRADYDMLSGKKDRTPLSVEEHSAMRRYEIESFYFQDATQELVETDNDGVRRWQIRNYERYTAPDENLMQRDRSDQARHAADSGHSIEWKNTLQELFNVAGLLDEQKRLMRDVIIEGDALKPFAALCIQNKSKIERLYEISVRHDVSKKPAQHLGALLAMIGIKWEKCGTKKIGETKVYRYKIPSSVLDGLECVVKRRADKDTFSQWHANRNATTENRLFPPEPDSGPDDEEVSSALAQVRRAIREHR